MIVELVQIGETPDCDLKDLATKITEAYRPLMEKCRPTEKLDMPSEAFSSERKQYLANKVLRHLEERTRKSRADKILGVTGEDLYSPNLNFVFGQARCPGTAAVISLHRLKPSFYKQGPDEGLFRDRATKEAIHELGHTFGLRHCENSKCVMSFSNSILDVDQKKPSFCRECKGRLDLN